MGVNIWHGEVDENEDIFKGYSMCSPGIDAWFLKELLCNSFMVIVLIKTFRSFKERGGLCFTIRTWCTRLIFPSSDSIFLTFSRYNSTHIYFVHVIITCSVDFSTDRFYVYKRYNQIVILKMKRGSEGRWRKRRRRRRRGRGRRRRSRGTKITYRG